MKFDLLPLISEIRKHPSLYELGPGISSLATYRSRGSAFPAGLQKGYQSDSLGPIEILYLRMPRADDGIIGIHYNADDTRAFHVAPDLIHHQFTDSGMLKALSVEGVEPLSAECKLDLVRQWIVHNSSHLQLDCNTTPDKKIWCAVFDDIPDVRCIPDNHPYHWNFNNPEVLAAAKASSHSVIATRIGTDYLNTGPMSHVIFHTGLYAERPAYLVPAETVWKLRDLSDGSALGNSDLILALEHYHQFLESTAAGRQRLLRGKYGISAWVFGRLFKYMEGLMPANLTTCGDSKRIYLRGPTGGEKLTLTCVGGQTVGLIAKGTATEADWINAHTVIDTIKAKIEEVYGVVI